MKKLLKQTEKRALVETRIFEEKLKRYEEEVANLRSRADVSKKRKVASGERQRSPVKQKKVVGVYGAVGSKGEVVGDSVVLLSSRL